MRILILTLLFISGCGAEDGDSTPTQVVDNGSVVIQDSEDVTVIVSEDEASGEDARDVIEACCEQFVGLTDDDCLRDAGFPDDLCRGEPDAAGNLTKRSLVIEVVVE